MQVDIEPGTYVAAVSGGVDSMVLLEALRDAPNLTVIVAHYDHGIRSDSNEDAVLVEATAKQYGMVFVSEQGRLGRGASEELARRKRYEFLQNVQSQHGARAIITAHHQDDVLETAILNLIRGTGRKGLTSLASTSERIRPFLHVSKQDILVYAKSHGVAWREDSTNQDDSYLRNKIRHNIMSRFNSINRARLLEIIDKQRVVNAQIDESIASIAPLDEREIPKQIIVLTPYDVSRELLASWLRAQSVEFDHKTIHRLTVGVKTLQAGKVVEASGRWVVRVGKATIALEQKVIGGKSSRLSV